MQIKIEVDFPDCEFHQFAEERGFHALFSCPGIAAASKVPNFCRVPFLVDGEKEEVLIAPLEARKFIVRSQTVSDSRSCCRISDSDIRYYAQPQDGMYWILETIFGGELEVEYSPDCISDWYHRFDLSAIKSGEEAMPMHEPESRERPTLRDLILATDLSLGIVVYVIKDKYFSYRFELPSECSEPEDHYRPSDLVDKLLRRIGLLKDSKLFDGKVMDHAAKICHGAGEGMVAFTVDA